MIYTVSKAGDPMFELTNDQRKCFGLDLVQHHWQRMEAKASPYHEFKTFLYLDGNVVVKCVMVGSKHYIEFGLNEALSEDGLYLLPKTAKGKPVKLSASTIEKRKKVGMCLHYHRYYLTLYNATTDRAYFTNAHIDLQLRELPDFIRWVEQWCEDTTIEDLSEVAAFAKEKRKTVRYKEGDVFRYKIDRKHYGYGRILLDYNKLRKERGEQSGPMWGYGLICSAYHILTKRKDVTVDELRGLKSLPSDMVWDNNIYYGENEIIGNIPVTDHEDYPILYGQHSGMYPGVWYECGKTMLCRADLRYQGMEFINNGISHRLDVKLDILRECIAVGSNMPYWEKTKFISEDLRNPKYRNELAKIKKQFGL